MTFTAKKIEAAMITKSTQVCRNLP